MSPEGPGAWSAGGTEALAVVVTAGVTPYLRRTLRALARQTAVPNAVVVVDVASRHNGLGDGTPVEETVAVTEIDARTQVRVVRVPDARGFGEAVDRGLALYDELTGAGPRKPSSRRRRSDTGSRRSRAKKRPTTRADRGERGWLWLLHDLPKIGRASCRERV